MTDIRRVANVVGLLLLVAVILPFVVYAVPQVVGASHSYVVLSDSMSPTIQAGDVVIVDDRQRSAIEEGDVITFRRTGTGSESDKVTHRVVDIVEKGGERRFETKGDANEEPDQRLVPASAVIGVVTFHIPLLGHALTLAGSQAGTMLLVVVPGILLVVSELWSLFRDASNDGGDTPVGEAE